MNIEQVNNNVRLEITSDEALELAQALIAQVAREKQVGNALAYSRHSIVQIGGKPAPGVLIINVGPNA